MDRPSLIEPGVKYFLNETLKNCHKFKEEHKNTLVNLALTIVFLVLLGALLLYKYKGKLTPEEIQEKEMEKKKYILSRIKNYQDAKIKAQQELITGLPHWETEYDILNYNTHKELVKHAAA